MKNKILAFSNTREIDVEWLGTARRDNFIGGLAILTAIFDVFHIDEMHHSSSALREGALYDLVGRSDHEDVCLRTIQSMQQRFSVDRAQAKRVRSCANKLFTQVEKDWGLTQEHRTWLRWAAEIHEVGLSISHVQFHKHGAYILRGADMPGFTRQEQEFIAFLVRGHRRRLPSQLLHCFSKDEKTTLLRLCVLLRLSVLLNRSRGESPPPKVKMTVGDTKTLSLALADESFSHYPLTLSELTEEAERLNAAKLTLSILDTE